MVFLHCKKRTCPECKRGKYSNAGRNGDICITIHTAWYIPGICSSRAWQDRSIFYRDRCIWPIHFFWHFRDGLYPSSQGISISTPVILGILLILMLIPAIILLIIEIPGSQSMKPGMRPARFNIKE